MIAGSDWDLKSLSYSLTSRNACLQRHPQVTLKCMGMGMGEKKVYEFVDNKVT